MWGGGVVRVSQLSTHPHNTNFPLFWHQNAYSENLTTKIAYFKVFSTKVQQFSILNIIFFKANLTLDEALITHSEVGLIHSTSLAS